MHYALKTLAVAAALTGWTTVSAQTFALERLTDSLAVLSLTGDDGWRDEWRLPYPVYQFQTGDIDGDGLTDAIVGVEKPTRYFPETGRRIFIFKQKRGKIRPLWMGSKLGGRLIDFKYLPPRKGDESPQPTDRPAEEKPPSQRGQVLALEQMNADHYAVSLYQWETFGMMFQRAVVRDTTKDIATQTFNDYEE